MTSVDTSPLAARIDTLLGTNPVPKGPIPTGLSVLDEVLDGGLRPGHVVVIASRPGAGCSTLALGIARTAALRHGIPSVFVAPASPIDELVDRVLSAETRTVITQFRTNTLDDSARRRVAEHRDHLVAGAFSISAQWSTPVEATTGRDVFENGRWNDRTLLVIDDLQTLEGSSRDLLRKARAQALQHGAAVVIVAALPAVRGATGAPTLEDLDQYDGLAEHADQVVVVHRDDLYDEQSTRAGEADLHVVKNRYGPTRWTTVLFQGHYARFVDITRNEVLA